MDRARIRFFAALGLFAAWIVGLGVMAFTTSEKPKAVEPPAPIARPE